MTNGIVRAATAADADVVHALIASHEAEGHLLPRALVEVRRHVSRFVVYEAGGAVRGCAELAPLAPPVAEIRSLVVADGFRRTGAATALVGNLSRRAAAAGFETLCAFTHDPRLFVGQNFSIVPHLWVPGKIEKDCVSCPLFRRCGQYAMTLALADVALHEVAHVELRRVAVA